MGEGQHSIQATDAAILDISGNSCWGCCFFFCSHCLCGSCQRLNKQLQHQLCRSLHCATSLQYCARYGTARWKLIERYLHELPQPWILIYKGFCPFFHTCGLPRITIECSNTMHSFWEWQDIPVPEFWTHSGYDGFSGSDISQSVLRSWSEFVWVKTTSPFGIGLQFVG